MHKPKEDIIIKKENHSKDKPKNNFLVFLDWLWNSDSIWSYAVFLILIFIVIKFVFLPGLGIAFSTCTFQDVFSGHSEKCLPLAIVESSSMEHYAINREICGKYLASNGFLNSEEYWNTCGDWYEQNTNITKEEFQQSLQQ